MRSLFFLFALLMAFSGLAVPEAVIARRAVRDPVIDGRLTEPGRGPMANGTNFPGWSVNM